MAKFDPSRVTGGTIELVRNPDGSYKSQVTGFNQIASLNLPEITTTAVTTTSDATKTAAEKAQENLQTQTSTAFKMPAVMAKGEQSDTADFGTTMTQEAAQTSKLLTETFKEPVEIKSPTNVFYDDMDQTTNQVNQAELGDTGSPIENILNEAKVKEAPRKETLGITVPTDRDLEADIGAQPREDIQSRPIKPSALKTFASSIKESFTDIRLPSVIGTVMRAVVPPETAVQKHAKKYFNVRDDGRIAGNPATDLYAGFNRTSAFGNLEKAGEKRIERREKTIERKGYGPGDKFYDDTQRMKDQQDDYKSSNAAAKARDSAVAQEKSNRDAARGINQFDENRGQGGPGDSKIVCTAMYKTTGLEEWKKHIRVWQIFERKYLTPYHEKGYHILFKPFVKGMHKSNIIKALGAHVAKHRTQDLKHIMFNSKPSWIGRIYRKILEPICYLVGRLWR